MPIIGILASGVIGFQNPSFLVFGSNTSGNAWSSTDGITWDYRQAFHRTDGTQPMFWSDIVDSKLYTADPDGFVYSSTNGTAWSVEKWVVNPNAGSVEGGYYVNNKWVITNNGKIYNSTDAITWIGSTTNFDQDLSTKVVYDGVGTYAVGGSTKVWTSTDLITWTSRTVTNATLIEGLEYAESTWVALVDQGLIPADRIFSSTDAITWTSRYTVTTYGDLSQRSFSLSYGNGIFLAGSNVADLLYYSTNGITWTTRTVSVGGEVLRRTGYANNYNFGLSIANNIIAYSTNGVTWTSRTISAANAGTGFNTIQYFNSKYYLFGEWDTTDLTPVYTSTDLVTWSPVSDSNSVLGKRDANALRSAVKVTDKYYIVGLSGYIVESNSDFTSWTVRDAGFTNVAINGITYGGSTFVVVGNSGRLATSTNGVTWTSRTSNFSTTNINKVTYGSSTFVAVGDGGKLNTSTDGITWTTRTSGFGTTSHILSVRYLNNTFLTAGQAGIVGNSTDGITWTTRQLGLNTEACLDTSYGAGVYLAVKENNRIYTSTDLTTWTARSSTLTSGSELTTALFANNIFVVLQANTPATNEFTRYQTSTDGITWTSRTLGQLPNARNQSYDLGSTTVGALGIAL